MRKKQVEVIQVTYLAYLVGQTSAQNCLAIHSDIALVITFIHQRWEFIKENKKVRKQENKKKKKENKNSTKKVIKKKRIPISVRLFWACFEIAGIVSFKQYRRWSR